ncbi:glycosidase [Arthrobacter sp. B1805]|uniref:pullulanase X25 domain-containing protein n=1 Tax=Arthrobacter sp. B1805 TaxID=2058892 RepID=UPI000CE36850|nr:glycosidase [Arthrobacter sp. B1805]
MSQAVAAAPFDAKESELLAGGVPRGFKALTTATSKLVKAGWLVKGRGGWTATEEGVRAVNAFPDPDSFVNAMISGAPIPEQPLEAPAHAPQSPEQLGEEAQAVQAEAPLAEDPTPPDVTPTLEVSAEEAPAGSGAPADTSTDTGAPAPAATAGDAWHDQPQSVTLSGDFDPLFGEAGHWSTDVRELQLSFDPAGNAWKQTLRLPAGTYQYKIVVNGSWDENYGRFGVRDGENHELHLLSDTAVTFRFDYGTKDIETS